MAKFLYRMQNVLDVKLKMEDQAKTIFSQAMMKLNEEEEKLQILYNRRDAYEDQGRSLRETVLNIIALKENAAALENLKGQIDVQTVNVDKAKESVEIARGKLQVAMQERKTQEKLKENAFEEFKRELNAAESKEVDELVSYRHGRKTE